MSDRTVTSRGAYVGAPAAFELPSKCSPSRRGDAAGRAFDLTLAVLLIAFTLPLLVAIALAVRLQDEGSIISAHQRVGRGGRLFRCLKYRIVSSEGAVTRVGDFLRQSGLDELPQLFNVLEGKMSLVGPRPHAVAHNELYRKLICGYMIRHKVRPGISGWAQVNGLRGETDTVDKMSARVKFDIDYLNQWSIWLDIKILVRTVLLVVRDHRAY